MSDFSDILEQRMKAQLAELKWTGRHDLSHDEFEMLRDALTTFLTDLVKLKEIRSYFSEEYGLALTESQCRLAAEAFLKREIGDYVPDYCGGVFLIFAEVERLAKKASKAKTKKKIDWNELRRGIKKALLIKKSRVKIESFEDLNNGRDSGGNELGLRSAGWDPEDDSSVALDVTIDAKSNPFNVEAERKWLEETFTALRSHQERLPKLIDALTALQEELPNAVGGEWRSWGDVWDSARQTKKISENIDLSWDAVVRETTEVLLSGELRRDTHRLVVDTFLNVLRDCYDQLQQDNSDGAKSVEEVKVELSIAYLMAMLSSMFEPKKKAARDGGPFALNQFQEFCTALAKSPNVVAAELFDALREMSSRQYVIKRLNDSILGALIMFALVTNGDVHQEFARLIDLSILPVNSGGSL